MHVFNGLNLRTGYLFMLGRSTKKSTRKQVDCLPASQPKHPRTISPSIIHLVSYLSFLAPSLSQSITLSQTCSFGNLGHGFWFFWWSLPPSFANLCQPPILVGQPRRDAWVRKFATCESISFLFKFIRTVYWRSVRYTWNTVTIWLLYLNCCFSVS